MTKDTETLKALVEAGDKAYHCYGVSEQLKDFADEMYFLIIAANARQALKEHLKYTKRLEDALERIASFDMQWAYGLDTNIEQIKDICEQALKQEGD